MPLRADRKKVSTDVSLEEWRALRRRARRRGLPSLSAYLRQIILAELARRTRRRQHSAGRRTTEPLAPERKEDAPLTVASAATPPSDQNAPTAGEPSGLHQEEYDRGHSHAL